MYHNYILPSPRLAAELARRVFSSTNNLKSFQTPVPEPAEGTQGYENGPEKSPLASSGINFYIQRSHKNVS
jgi:hypothetical protein